MARTVLLYIHRYLGLSAAAFLVLMGLTGSVITFEAELDAWLNPDLFAVETSADRALMPSQLVNRVEHAFPKVRVYHLSLSPEADRAVVAYVSPRTNTDTGKPYDVEFDEVFVNPVTGEIQGKRLWGACCLQPHNLVPFLYKLHNRLLLPMSVGRPVVGVIAGSLLVLAIVGAWLTLPRTRPFWRGWRRSWTLARKRGLLSGSLQLHRAAGLWFWPLIMALALTGLALGLESQTRSVVGVVSPLSENVWEQRADRMRSSSGSARVSFTVALRAASAQPDAAQAGAVRSITYSEGRGLYRVAFGDPDAVGVGPVHVYVDDRTSVVVSVEPPGQGSAGDFVMAAAQPLHAGRIAGLPGRIAVASAGVVLALIAIIGVLLYWLRRRRARSAFA